MSEPITFTEDEINKLKELQTKWKANIFQRKTVDTQLIHVHYGP